MFWSAVKKAHAEWVLEGDIEGYLDNIGHDWIIDNIPMDKVILRKWLKAGYVYQIKLFPTLPGTPEGIIPTVLANMTLDELDPYTYLSDILKSLLTHKVIQIKKITATPMRAQLKLKIAMGLSGRLPY